MVISIENKIATNDVFAEFIEETVLSDRRTLEKSVHYAIENSLSALRNSKSVESLSCTAHIHVVFDWFLMLARAFRAVPTGMFKISGDSLWVSKDVVLSISLLSGAAPTKTASFLDTYADDRNHSCGASAISALREVNFEGELVRQFVESVELNENSPFSSGRAFMLYALQYAREAGKPMHSLEMICNSMFFSWSMDTTSDSPPWARRWRVFNAGAFVRKLQNTVATFQGQREASDMFFSGGKNDALAIQKAAQGTLSGASLAFRGLWILGAGNNKGIRSLLTTKTTQSPRTAWGSFMAPWACFTFIDAASLEPRKPYHTHADTVRLLKIEAVLRIAAVVDSAPEAYDVCLDAWVDYQKHAQSIISFFPHLAHVVEKCKRYFLRFKPPSEVCEAILRSAAIYEQTWRHKGRYFSSSEVQAAKEKNLMTFAEAELRMRENGCFSAAVALSSFVSKREKSCEMWVFDPRGPISWVDLVFSQKYVWPVIFDAEEPVLFRTTRQYFVVFSKALGNPQVFEHPLSFLRKDTSHPLRGPRDELLAACV